RGFHVTGVQTCALPIWAPDRHGLPGSDDRAQSGAHDRLAAVRRAAPASWHEGRGGGGPGRRTAGDGGDRLADAARGAVSAPALEIGRASCRGRATALVA